MRNQTRQKLLRIISISVYAAFVLVVFLRKILRSCRTSYLTKLDHSCRYSTTWNLCPPNCNDIIVLLLISRDILLYLTFSAETAALSESITLDLLNYARTKEIVIRPIRFRTPLTCEMFREIYRVRDRRKATRLGELLGERII